MSEATRLPLTLYNVTFAPKQYYIRLLIIYSLDSVYYIEGSNVIGYT
jgi:hypothetical protein